jgi:hypothetical protein
MPTTLNVPPTDPFYDDEFPAPPCPGTPALKVFYEADRLVFVQLHRRPAGAGLEGCGFRPRQFCRRDKPERLVVARRARARNEPIGSVVAREAVRLNNVRGTRLRLRGET